MRRASRLLSETSPYLLQHVHNPVDWYPWGEEALARAVEEDKPIFLSIGYAACHWCHVMAHESFTDDRIAELLNENFVSIKVDREERPDVDAIYMAATLALNNGNGGWPMSAFLTPQGEPFFAGTYFPPHDSVQGPGLSTLLSRLAEMWKNERSTLQEQARQLTEHIQRGHRTLPATGVSDDALYSACRSLHKQFDLAFGGFGDAPKFPPSAALSLLMRQHRRTGQKELLTMVKRTLDMMMSGGLFDQLAGGFSRYSVDNKWLVPHFEKMLYDNALLADVYLEAFQVTGRSSYRAVVRETLDYLLREMQSPQGAFFSSSDADSEGGEGAYYLWTTAEVRSALGEPLATHFCEFFGITEQGNFQGKNVLSTRRSLKDVASRLGISDATLVSSIEAGRAILLQTRTLRSPPSMDDKILCGQNGLLIRALANAGRALTDPKYIEAAQHAADFVLGDAEIGEGMRMRDGRLVRTFRAGQSRGKAFLEDYAYLADGLLCLYEAGGGSEYLGVCESLCRRMCADFSSSEGAAENFGALFSTPIHHEKLISRPVTGHDEALPNDNAVAARVLARLAHHTQNDEYRRRALGIVVAFSAAIKRSPRAFCTMLGVVDFLLEPPLEIVLSGAADAELWAHMAQILGHSYLPQRVEARLHSKTDELGSGSPLARDRFVPGMTRTYLCRNSVCEAPIESAEELSMRLAFLAEENLRSRRRELMAGDISGRATAEGTAAWRVRCPLPENAFTTLDGLWISRIGLGTYRVGLDHLDHKKALRAALLGGINLIDTSPSFALGDSERLIGQVLSELIGEGAIERENVVVLSKVGLALGPLAAELEQKRLEGTLDGEAVPLSSRGREANDASLESGAYCLTPSFLVEQVENSLARLGLRHLDICLIQSPEHLLSAGLSKDHALSVLREAFAALKVLVQEGKVGVLGVLSNTLCGPTHSPLHLSLGEILEAVDSAGASESFRVIELPINLAESEAVQPSDGGSFLDVAQRAGLAVLACRPLSVTNESALLRLVDPPALSNNERARNLSGARYRVASLEAEFETTLAPALRVSGRIGPQAILPLSSALGQAIEKVETLSQFEQAETTLVTPKIRQLLAQLEELLQEEPRWEVFRERYIEAVGVWLACVRQRAIERTLARLAEIRDAALTSPFSAHIGEFWCAKPWVQRALDPLLGTSGITCVVLGMRSQEQAEQALFILRVFAESENNLDGSTDQLSSGEWTMSEPSSAERSPNDPMDGTVKPLGEN